MELNEIKDLWQKMDATIQQNQKLNEKLINTIIETRTKSAANKLVVMEYVNIITAAIVLFIMLLMPNKTDNSMFMNICYGLSAIIIVLAIIISAYNVAKVSAIDIAKDSLTAAMKKTQQFRLLMAKEKVVAFIVGPVFLVSLYVVAFYVVYHENVLKYNAAMFYTRSIAGCIVYTIAAFLVYRKFYDKQIKNIADSLGEIESFKQ